MIEHSTPDPASHGGTSNIPSIDLVAGDPPVPITVWRTARSGDDLRASISHRLAHRLIAAYSRPGEAVVDLTDSHALDDVCLRGGRRHHRAWFTDARSLVVGAATPPPRRVLDGAADTDVETDEPLVWFGDDLTDPDLPPAEESPTVLRDGDSLRQRTSLVVASWPLDETSDAENQVRLAWLLTAGERLLRPGGCLVLIVGVPAGAVATPEDFTPVVQAAANTGLGYLQHIVAVSADTDGDRFTYHATDEELLALARASGAEHVLLHVKVHADLLVFTRATGNRAGGRRA
ncbi:hypothetical protein [Plantactinospora sp. CA-290183]|uniref:hypothetical protein n=1 Tax=Plantactinospora sp. CA-290183 TaxID=3240006 RepID=UPI003D8ADF7A